MAEYRVVHEKIGKYTHGNTITFPNGAVLVADNYEAVRDNVYRKNRGREHYGKLPDLDIQQIMAYRERAYLHLGDDSIWYDSSGTGLFVEVASDVEQPDANTLMRELEFSGNMYFTTSEGVMLFDDLGAVALGAGEPRGLDVDLMLADGGVWLLNGNAVAYRHVWTYVDENNNKTTGSPSERAEISTVVVAGNSVLQRIFIPEGITTDHTLEVYRSSQVVLATTPPEDFQLCYQAHPTAGELAAGVMEFEDLMPDGFRGAFLYTNTTQEGLAQANENPPLCMTMDKYRGYVFFGDVTGLARLYTALIATAGLTAGVSTLTITDTAAHTITLGCLTEIADNTVIATNNVGGEVEIQTGVNHGFTTGDYVNIHGVTGTVEANGLWVVTVTGLDTFTLDGSAYVNAWIADGVVEQYVDYGATPRFIIYTAGTVAQNINNTARSIVKTINLATGNTWWYAYYTSSVTDPPGKFILTGRLNDNVQFHITADTDATGGSFSPSIPTAGTEYISNSSAYSNGLMYSKEQQAEHVPLVNILYAGSQNDPILRVVGLKDSLIIIKENDGIYRLTGTSPANFILTELDGTCKCLQKESVCKGDNAVFMMSNQGRVKISDSGVEVIGRDNEYQDLKPTRNANYATTGFGWYYPTEKNYYLSTMKDENSTTFDTVAVYNTFTLGWTDRAYGVYTNDTQIRCAKVIDDICYYAPLTGGGLLRERKTFTAADMASPDVDVIIASIDLDTNIIETTAAITIPKGSLLEQGAFSIRIVTVIDTTHFTVIDANPFAVGAAVVVPGIVSRIKYHQCHCGVPDIEKNFQELSLLFDDEETDIQTVDVSVYTDQRKLESDVTSMGGSGIIWGTPDWGEYWLASNVTDKWRTLFPQQYSKGSHCYIEIEHSNAEEQVGICGYTVKFEPTGARYGRE